MSIYSNNTNTTNTTTTTTTTTTTDNNNKNIILIVLILIIIKAPGASSTPQRTPRCCRGFAVDVSLRGDTTMTGFAAWEIFGDQAGLTPNHWTLKAEVWPRQPHPSMSAWTPRLCLL